MEQSTTKHSESVGKLRSDIKIELHTIPTIQIWHGREKSDNKNRIFSMTRAISHLRVIELATNMDDPYADMRLTGVYEQIAEIKKLISMENQSIDEVLRSVPTGFTVGEAVSIKPVDLNLFINVPSGYQLVFLLCEFDLLIRKIQLAKHISLISGTDASNRQNVIGHKFRSLITYTTKYIRTGVVRKDFEENTELATSAIEKCGPVPEAILNADKNRERTV